jgi:hypothetical protein
MADAQPDPQHRYYGSSLVVANAAKAVGGSADLWVSDADGAARRAFAECGCPSKEISTPGFSSSDGFSVLSCDIDADLLLLDPFADFLRQRADEAIPLIPGFSIRAACVLFVLNLDPRNEVGRHYGELRSKHLPGAWSMHCPKLLGTVVRGEAKYEVEVLLAWASLGAHPRKGALRSRLASYAKCLSAILNTTITFQAAE